MKVANLVNAEPLLQAGFPPSACCCGREALVRLSVLIGRKALVRLSLFSIGLSLAMLLSRLQMPCAHGNEQNFAVQQPIISMTSLLQPSFSSFRWIQPVPAAVDRFQSLSASSAARPIEEGALPEFVSSSSGLQMPRLMFDTAHQEKFTESRFLGAVGAGMSGFDVTVNPRYCALDGVRQGLSTLALANVARDKLFVQTKVDPSYAADLNPDLPIKRQVELLVEKALSGLQVKFVDSLVLESLYEDHAQTMEAWHAMEDLVRAGFVRQLGISTPFNSLAPLQRVYTDATLKPVVVQQRYYALPEYEREIRAWCVELGLYFQTSWTDTVYSQVVISKTMLGLAEKYGVKPSTLLFRFMMGQGVIPLISPYTDPKRMKEELLAWSVPLKAPDAEIIDGLLKHAADEW